MTDDRIGTWLRETRLRQVMPGTRKHWSQDYLIAQMAEAGWAPHRPNYSKYENGKAKPEPDTLDKFIAFWAGRGEPGPDLTPAQTLEPPVDPVVQAIKENTEMLRQVLKALTARLPEPPPELFRDLTEAEVQAESEQANTRKPLRSVDREHRVGDRGRELPEAAAS